MPKGIFFKRCGPFDFNSAGGGVYVAEEQQNVASFINFWPKNERFQYLLMLEMPFFKKLMDRMKVRFTGLSFAGCRKFFFDTLKRAGTEENGVPARFVLGRLPAVCTCQKDSFLFFVPVTLELIDICGTGMIQYACGKELFSKVKNQKPVNMPTDCMEVF